MKNSHPLFENKSTIRKLNSDIAKSTNKIVKVEYNNKEGNKLLKTAKTNETCYLIKSLYRNKARIGKGGVADAINYEIKHNTKINGKSHIQKGIESVKHINNMLKNNPNHPDKKLLIKERNKIQRALKRGGNKKWHQKN